MTEKEALKRFGENLKDILDECFITQKDLAEYIGVSESSVSCYVNGLRAPTLKTLLNIMYATYCSSEDLINFYGKID